MKNLFKLSILLAFIGCNNTSQEKVKQLKWLEGTWINNGKEAKFTETWQLKNDQSLIGKSYIVVNKDTVFYEDITLQQVHNDVFYNVFSKGQKDNKPVSFKMLSFVDDCVIFENPEHDFPQKIIYKLVTKDSIVATILGNQDGKIATEIFPMKKL